MFKRILYCIVVFSTANFGIIAINATSLNTLFSDSGNTIAFHGKQILVNNLDKTSDISPNDIVNSKEEQDEHVTTFINTNSLPISQNNIRILANISGNNNISLQKYDNKPIPNTITFCGNNSQFNGRLYLHPKIKEITFTTQDSIIKNLNVPVKSGMNRIININLPEDSYYQYTNIPNNLFVKFNKYDWKAIDNEIVKNWEKISGAVYNYLIEQYKTANKNYSITSDDYKTISIPFQETNFKPGNNYQHSKITIKDFIKEFHDATMKKKSTHPTSIEQNNTHVIISEITKKFLSAFNKYLPEDIDKIDETTDIQTAISSIKKVIKNITQNKYNINKFIEIFNSSLPHGVQKIQSIDKINDAILQIQELNNQETIKKIIVQFNKELPKEVKQITNINEIPSIILQLKELNNTKSIDLFTKQFIEIFNSELPDHDKITDINEIPNKISSIITHSKKEQDIFIRNNLIKLINDWFNILGIEHRITTGKDAKEVVQQAIEAVSWKNISVECNSIAKWDWKNRVTILDCQLINNDLKNYNQVLNIKYDLNKKDFSKQDILDELEHKGLTIIYDNNKLYKINDISKMKCNYYMYPSNKCIFYKNEHRLPLYCQKCYFSNDHKSKCYKGYILLDKKHNIIKDDNGFTTLYSKKHSKCSHNPEYNEKYILTQLPEISNCITLTKFDAKMYNKLETK